MQTPIIMPEIGSEEEPVIVSAWLVERGDTVMVGDRIVEVSIKGVTFDITSESSGQVAKIELPVGREATVGATLGWIDCDS